jgi:hypothetical protein
MVELYSQFGGGDFVSTLIWFVLFFVFILFYPRLMIAQMVYKLERETIRLETWSKHSREIVTKHMNKKISKDLKNAIDRFVEFFMVLPVDLDPSGIIKKLDRTIIDQRDKFTVFVKEYSDTEDEEVRNNLESGLSGAMTVHQIAKIVRHFLEMTKRYKNLQLAMILQMQLPMIKDIARAALKGTRDLCNGDPVGDGIGPLVIAELIGDEKAKELEGTEMVYARKKIKGRECILVKAKGPGARIGYPGKALDKLIDLYNPDRVITIDAAGKLEGEPTGSVAEGVGVAMGGFGVERYHIEEKTTKKNIPIDAIAIKMRPEEAIFAMKEEVFKSVPTVVATVEKLVQRAPESKKVLILGPGNSSGIGNDKKSLEAAEKAIQENIKKMKQEELEEKKEEGFLDKLSPF